jgi:molecular chaperone GrpE (heat shock protein)
LDQEKKSNMDERLQVTEARREGVPDALADIPPVTIAWRALRAEHQRRLSKQKQVDAENKRIQDALISIAEEVFRLKRIAHTASNGKQGEALLAAVSRLETALAKADLTFVAPEGESFTPELMELLESVAQQPTPGISAPHVLEVIIPAIIYRDALLRMGKAVIAVPADENRE